MKSVTIYATSRCNLRCKHCGVGPDQEEPRQAPTTTELRHVLTELAGGGARTVTILGGEVTKYRDDLADLLDHAASIRVAVSINTNLLEFDAIEALLDKPALRSLIVSIDGASETTHDAVRGRGTFRRTTSNVLRVASHPRMANGQLIVQIAFVVSAINVHETASMLQLARQLGATHLNVKNVKLLGRAATYSNELRLKKRDLLEAYTLLIVTWMLKQDVQLEVFVPPSFATYLNRRFDLRFPTTEHHACGGANVFSYVDLRGNHLPCPAMAYEENLNPDTDARLPGQNLRTRTIAETFETPAFVEFERRRVGRSYMNQMYPCRYCTFRDQCVPCTADLIKGHSEDSVDICSALFEYGDEHAPGLRSEIWSQAPAFPR